MKYIMMTFQIIVITLAFTSMKIYNSGVGVHKDGQKKQPEVKAKIYTRLEPRLTDRESDKRKTH